MREGVAAGARRLGDKSRERDAGDPASVPGVERANAPAKMPAIVAVSSASRGEKRRAPRKWSRGRPGPSLPRRADVSPARGRTSSGRVTTTAHPVVGRRYFKSSVGGGATPRLARGGRAGGMDDFKAWLRSSDFWWDSRRSARRVLPLDGRRGSPGRARASARSAGSKRATSWRASARAVPDARLLRVPRRGVPSARVVRRRGAVLACLGAALLLGAARLRGASSFAPYLASPRRRARRRRVLARPPPPPPRDGRRRRAQGRARADPRGWDGGVAEALAEAERRDDAETTNETTAMHPAGGGNAASDFVEEDFLALADGVQPRVHRGLSVDAGLVLIADLPPPHGRPPRAIDGRPGGPCGRFRVDRRRVWIRARRCSARLASSGSAAPALVRLRADNPRTSSRSMLPRGPRGGGDARRRGDASPRARTHPTTPQTRRRVRRPPGGVRIEAVRAGRALSRSGRSRRTTRRG